jgi:hypothetical protein
MDFIEISDSVDYENVGYVNENGTFEKVSTADDVTNVIIGNPPQNLVDNQSFYRDFAKKNPPQYQQPPPQQFPRPILKQNTRSPQMQQPQKKVTYDDILSSLNMKVVNGKLQIVRGDDAQPLPAQMQRGRQVPPSRPQHQHTQSQAYTKQNEFYNKFLQAQQQQQQMQEMVEEEEIELTPEQIAAQQQYHKRLMMIQYIKNQQQRQRVGQIKSKKMKFV